MDLGQDTCEEAWRPVPYVYLRSYGTRIPKAKLKIREERFCTNRIRRGTCGDAGWTIVGGMTNQMEL